MGGQNIEIIDKFKIFEKTLEKITSRKVVNKLLNSLITR
jgi:hypothetical protein